MELLHFSHGNCTKSGEEGIKEENTEEDVSGRLGDIGLLAVGVTFSEDDYD